MDRREFLKASTAAGAGLALAGSALGQTAPADDRPVRVGMIGIGRRGGGLLGLLLNLKGVRVPAVCDVDAAHLKAAQDAVEKAGQPRPEGYTGDEHAYRKLLARNDVDAVVIATPWEWHTPMTVEAMKAGKYAACEVPIAMSMEACWELVNTHEATGVPCMMLENWSFRQDNLALLNMIRKGLFGEMVHCHCAHSHNCIDHFYWDVDGSPRWPAKYLEKYNRDQYPTHSMGPVLSWMDIPCGDTFAYATATASASLGINAHFARLLGKDHPMAKKEYPQGDIVTTVVKTHKGRTIVINNDMQLPRPYDNRWLIQGTVGLYDEERQSVYIHGKSPQAATWEPFAAYQQKYEHAWYKRYKTEASAASHAGTDYLELCEFVRAVRNRTQTPLDVYESVLMSAIIPLSEQSIAKGSAPVACPDFTRGKWKTRKPTFAVET